MFFTVESYFYKWVRWVKIGRVNKVKKKKQNKNNIYSYRDNCDSEITQSIGGIEEWIALPVEERVPLIACFDGHNSEKQRLHRSQDIVEL